jgi:ApbE superfamily uncharacterized protein (UPF0280 family)
VSAPVSGPVAGLLPDGRRLHLQHGPIDLVIEAFGAPTEAARAYAQATARFQDILAALVDELGLLRTPLGPAYPTLRGPVARRMAAACWPYRAGFITSMAAVAGAVADEVLAALVAGRNLVRAYVNNGGDIALHLTPGVALRAGIVADVAAPAVFGSLELRAEMPVRGIATSGRATKGQGGRSFSLGIADSVTVLARDAAAADAAATVIGNAVDLNHPAIHRLPARDIDPDSDLGEIPVTVEVADLEPGAIVTALANGVAKAQELQQAGLIHGAVLTLAGVYRLVGNGGIALAAPPAAA